MLTKRAPVALVAAVAALVIVAFTAGSLVAQTPTPPRGSLTHEQMHQQMDAMHGAGTSQRLHQAMGAPGEQMMDQCVAMMGMMPGMMGGQPGHSMPDMMGRMMGR